MWSVDGDLDPRIFEWISSNGSVETELLLLNDKSWQLYSDIQDNMWCL